MVLYQLDQNEKKDPLQEEQKKVFVLRTIRGDHSRLPFYNLKTIRIILDHIKTDILFIKDDPKTYQEKIYEKISEKDYMDIRPIEIQKVLTPYAKKHKIKVVSIDWKVCFDKKYWASKPIKDDFYKKEIILSKDLFKLMSKAYPHLLRKIIN